MAVNDTLCKRLGYEKDEIVGKKLDLLFTVATRIFQQTHFAPLLKMQGHAEEIFITLLAKGGDHVAVLINAERQEDDGETMLVYVGIEVPNRKKFEDELIAAKKAAEKALNDNSALAQMKKELEEHLEVLAHQMHVSRKQHTELLQFNKVITHDLQEPLRKLSVFTNMIISSDGRQPQETVVARLNAALAQMRTVTSGLQQYMWLTDSPVHLSTVDLGDIVLDVKEELRYEHPAVNLELDVEELPSIVADPEQMRVLFYQLLSNVVRFRKEGDEAFVSISAHKLLLNKFKSIEGRYKYSNFLKLELTDRGKGFDNEYKDKVFELFKKLHPESGRGLGLSLCKKIIESHHGSISISAREGEGTTVTVLLPAELPEVIAHKAELINV
jgi:sigma-B regulation protein RsbU (phosphoserine phosphatase)